MFFLNEVVQFYSQQYFHLRYLLKLTVYRSLSLRALSLMALFQWHSSASHTGLPLRRVPIPKELFSSKIVIIGLTRATGCESIQLPARW